MQREDASEPLALPNTHGNIGCRCGCVPNIKSLFEMAELRAKRRAEKAAAIAVAAVDENAHMKVEESVKQA